MNRSTPAKPGPLQLSGKDSCMGILNYGLNRYEIKGIYNNSLGLIRLGMIITLTDENYLKMY